MAAHDRSNGARVTAPPPTPPPTAWEQGILEQHPESCDLTVVNILAELLVEVGRYEEVLTAIAQARSRYCAGGTLPVDLTVKVPPAPLGWSVYPWSDWAPLGLLSRLKYRDAKRVQGSHDFVSLVCRCKQHGIGCPRLVGWHVRGGGHFGLRRLEAHAGSGEQGWRVS